MSTDIRSIIDLLEAKSGPEKLSTEPLPYPQDGLSPVLSGDSIDYHYSHLAKSYADRYNAGEGDPEFNRAGSFLHNLYFPQLQPPGGPNRPTGAVLELIERKFGTYDEFREEFGRVAMAIQGSGWVYLSTGGKILTIPNHAIRSDICVLVDWWEHAWALDYAWDKAAYLKNTWRIINWQVCSDRLRTDAQNNIS